MLRPRAALLAAGLVAVLTAPARAEDADTARFNAAIALEAQGEARIPDAVAALEAFAASRPEHALAADALAEAAALVEGRLHDPARALALWTRLAERYPQSRGARRALTRRAELEHLMAAGGDSATIGAFQKMIAEAGVPARPAARQAVARFLVEHPGFPLTDQGLFWLGHAAEQVSDDEEALRRYDEAVRLGGGYAARALRARGELLLRLGRLEPARQTFTELGRFTDPVSQAAREAGLRGVRVAGRRAAWAYAAGAAILLFAALALVRGRRQVWPPSIEVRYFAPIALVFAIASWTEHRAIGRAISVLAIGGTVLIWLGAAAQRTMRAHAARLLVALATAATLVGIAYLSIYWNGLVDLVIETWRAGPDR